MTSRGRSTALKEQQLVGRAGAGIPARCAGREGIPCSCKRSPGDGEQPDPHHHDWRPSRGGEQRTNTTPSRVEGSHVSLLHVEDHLHQSELPPSGDCESVRFPPAPQKHEPDPERGRTEGDVSQRGHDSRWARPALGSPMEADIAGRTRPNISRLLRHPTAISPRRLARAATRVPCRLSGCDLACDLSVQHLKSPLHSVRCGQGVTA